MKYLIRTFIGIIMLGSWISISATDWKKYAYDTYAERNFSGWPNMIENLKSKAFSPTGTFSDRIQVMTCYYGYIGHLLDIKQKDKASEWSKKANETFNPLQRQAPNDPRILALQSMFVAYEIAISPVKAPFQVGGMMSTAKKALKTDPTLYLAALANANILFYFPEALGGNKQQAITYYKKVYDYFMAHPEIASTDWMYLNVMSTLAVAYEAVGNNNEALSWCKKALLVAPEFVYVKTILLPRIQAKVK
ncbi:MAG: hypothetical protein RR212_03090 [Bacteroidales bacterium]